MDFFIISSADHTTNFFVFIVNIVDPLDMAWLVQIRFKCFCHGKGCCLGGWDQERLLGAENVSDIEIS